MLGTMFVPTLMLHIRVFHSGVGCWVRVRMYVGVKVHVRVPTRHGVCVELERRVEGRIHRSRGPVAGVMAVGWCREVKWGRGAEQFGGRARIHGLGCHVRVGIAARREQTGLDDLLSSRTGSRRNRGRCETTVKHALSMGHLLFDFGCRRLLLRRASCVRRLCRRLGLDTLLLLCLGALLGLGHSRLVGVRLVPALRLKTEH